MTVRVKVGTDFSRFPGGRTKKDGPWSGEAFRERFLEAALRSGDEVIVDLAGTEGYGSSFLEEAFGGLAREQDIPKDAIRNKLVVYSSDPDLESFVEDTKQYISDSLVEQ